MFTLAHKEKNCVFFCQTKIAYVVLDHSHIQRVSYCRTQAFLFFISLWFILPLTLMKNLKNVCPAMGPCIRNSSVCLLIELVIYTGILILLACLMGGTGILSYFWKALHKVPKLFEGSWERSSSHQHGGHM